MSWSTILLCAFITILTFLTWEFVAWFSHKYIMHGFLWVWHQSHHTVHDHTFERNDWFGVVFSIPSIALFYYGSVASYSPYVLSIALGILCYGIFYFIFHDVIVHQRIKWKPLNQSNYLKRMIYAHYVHHSKHSKDGCEAFGFLYASKKYAPENFKFKKNRQATQ